MLVGSLSRVKGLGQRVCCLYQWGIEMLLGGNSCLTSPFLRLIPGLALAGAQQPLLLPSTGQHLKHSEAPPHPQLLLIPTPATPSDARIKGAAAKLLLGGPEPIAGVLLKPGESSSWLPSAYRAGAPQKSNHSLAGTEQVRS